MHTLHQANLSTVQVHCAGGVYEAHFGGGTRLTVLGKKLTLSSLKKKKQIQIQIQI